MKIAKRLLILLIAAAAILQIPFIYRRVQLGNAAAEIERANAARTVPDTKGFAEYKGIIHAHTSLGGHSTGHFDELIPAANANGLDFVVMTEHYSELFDTAAHSLSGTYGRTLFVAGNEVDTADGDRFLLIPGGPDAAGFRSGTTPAFLEKIHAENRLAFITYPEKFRSWNTAFDGDEVFSVHTQAKNVNKFSALFDLLWSYPAYPALTLTRHFSRPDANLQRYDETAMQRPVTLFPGTDAHSNIGFHIFGDDAGNQLLGFKIDDYASTFGIVRAHVLLDASTPFTQDSLIDALRRGRVFIGLDATGDTDGFRFTAETANGTAVMGDTITVTGGEHVRLKAAANRPARFVFLKNGVVAAVSSESGELSSSQQTVAVEPGVYRVEVYLDSLGAPFNKMPWIISNPIYIRPAAAQPANENGDANIKR